MYFLNIFDYCIVCRIRLLIFYNKYDIIVSLDCLFVYGDIK